MTGSTASDQRNTPLLGIALLVAATVLFACQDLITKLITHKVPPAQIVFVRFAVFALFAIVYASARTGLVSALRSRVPALQILRCSLMTFEMATFAFALRFLGIAEIHAIFACFPLFATALSVPLLGEDVGWRRWAAVTTGFLGTLLILRPGSGVFEPAALLGILCALIYAFYNLLTRRVARHDSFESSLLYFGLVGFLASGLFVVGRWQPLDNTTALWLGLLCLTSLTSHMLLIKALEVTAAVILQPFNYLILVWAILLGYVVTGEVLDAPSLVGAAIVSISGIYIGLREYRLARAGTR